MAPGCRHSSKTQAWIDALGNDPDALRRALVHETA